MKKYITYSILLLTILMSCQKLVWNNPFDASCPKDFWAPTDFKAVQEGQTIKLTWVQPVSQISAFWIDKTVDGIQGGNFTVEKGINQFTDPFNISGGKVYSYTIVAQAGNNRSNSVTTKITPILAAGGVATNSVGTITAVSAISGGSITNDGGSPISARGVCWATTANPTIAGSKTSDGTGTGSFTSSLTGLTPNTTYFVRAYAINAAGTTYGNEVNFRTSTGISTVTTSSATNITTTTVTSGGYIANDGGAAITSRGVCWATTSTPTVSGNKTTDGTGIGAFASSLTGLIPNTTYYVRAYSTNAVGTIYGNEVTFKTLVAPILFNSTKTYGTASDVDGNTYKTIQIGTQLWMAENLKTTRYKDGSGIPLVTDGTAWKNLTSPGYSWYNNDQATYKDIFGALYNWYTVNTGKLCPTGWKVPTDAEWTTLANYLGGISLAGGKLKELGTGHWLSPNTGATNESGYTALSGGGRSATDGTFNYNGNDGNWWSSPEYSATVAYNMSLYSGSGTEYLVTNPKTYGYSVRCIAETLSVPTLSTNSVTGINFNSSTSGGVISSDGGAAITARGVCWSTTSNPTISNSKTSNGTGTGAFTSSITGLAAATTYYLRAYVTNSAGTFYGNEISFTTDPVGTLGISINFNDKPITLYSGLAADGPYQLNGYTYPYVIIVFGLEGTLNFTYHTAVVQNNLGYQANPIWWGLGGIGGEEVDMGIVSGLGSVVTKPTTGWAPNRAIQVGHGYVVRYKKSKDLTSPSLPYLYARVYVADLLKNSTGTTIGILLKYETSF